MADLSEVRSWPKRFWKWILEFDNTLIGTGLCFFALYDWISFYDQIDRTSLYYAQGIVGLPSLNILSVLASAIYLTAASLILLSLRRPLKRYENVLPNLLALLAGFGVYMFTLVPGGNVLHASVYVALSLVVAGTALVLVSLIFLRQAFSVTPQARFLVRGGPYAIVRHPMYVGNILSILGLSLLIDSWEAYCFFVLCAGLQIVRASYEERILAAALPAYAEYRSRVGRFFPKAVSWRPLKVSLGIILLSASFCTTAVAEDWAKKCIDWNKRATSGAWFSSADRKELEKYLEVYPNEENEPVACRPFRDLQGKCLVIMAERWGVEKAPISPQQALKKIAASPGCSSIVGLDDMCELLEGVAKKGVLLSEDEKTIMADCFATKLRNQRVNFLRPAM